MFPLQIRPLAFEDSFGNELELNRAEDGALGERIGFHITTRNKGALHIALPSDLAPTIRERVCSLQGGKEKVRFDDGFGNRLEIYELQTSDSEEVTVFQIVTNRRKAISIQLPVGMIPDVLAYMEWIIHPQTEPPQFISRIRKAASYSRVFDDVDDILGDLASMADEDVARILMNLAGCNRIDLAVNLLKRLGSEGRFNQTTGDIGFSYYSWEKPSDVTWNDLVMWAGIGPYPQVEITGLRENKPLGQYQAYDYVACFENAFGDSLERLPFETMDFRAEQGGLRRLDRNLNQFFSEVKYPIADQDEIIPLIVGKNEWTRGEGFSRILFSYTPPIWYQEARKYLLFAHKVAFEDPLTQIIDPIVSNINNRSYHYDDVYVKPAMVHSSHIDMLRSMLINTQRMSRLIRDGIVIPHCLLNERIPGFSRGEYSSMRFPDQETYFVMEGLSKSLGALISGGYVDGFGVPDYLVRKAKDLASYYGGDWEDIDWFLEFFDEISIHDEELDQRDPIRDWPDHLYRIGLYRRYFDAHKLGYSLHFLHRHGYQIYSILEAADLVTSLTQNDDHPALDSIDYARSLGGDAVLVNTLDSALQPKLDVLTDDDLASIRFQEDLFEDWRDTLRGILTTVQNYESGTGKRDERVVVDEVTQRFQKWEDLRVRRLKKTVLGNLFDIGSGAGVSLISSLAFGGQVSLPKLSVGALYAVLKGTGRIFSWRRKENLVKRHFLSVV